jgi:hypothetical protein
MIVTVRRDWGSRKFYDPEKKSIISAEECTVENGKCIMGS